MNHAAVLLLAFPLNSAALAAETRLDARQFRLFDDGFALMEVNGQRIGLARVRGLE